MVLNKNQIEAIRYQLKKNNLNATNDEIRLAANDFIDFDAILIADKIISNKSNSLAIKSDSNDELDSSMIDLYQSNSNSKSELSLREKNELIKIKSIELGIDLSVSDVEKISDMVSKSVDDALDYLDEVSIIILDFFNDRNKKASNIINQKINDISRIINSKNEALGDIFESANTSLNDLISDCSREKLQYKSPYKSKLESIKELLKIQS